MHLFFVDPNIYVSFSQGGGQPDSKMMDVARPWVADKAAERDYCGHGYSDRISGEVAGSMGGLGEG